MKTNQIENCTHPVPKNNFGIFAMHCRDNQPLSDEDLLSVINGPVTEVEKEFQKELASNCKFLFDNSDLPLHSR